MAQSYGNLNPTVLANATDSITGVASIEQELGTSISAASPQGFAAPSTLIITTDVSGAQTITIPASLNVYDICTSIQTQMDVFDPKFVARYDSGLNQVILSSGTAGAAASSCVVSGGSAQPFLKLGAAFGGTESYAGHEIVTYIVTYLFVYNGASFGAGSVLVKSSDLASPLSLVDLEAVANGRAAQLKVELQPGFGINPPIVVTSPQTINGPVILNT
jgi:hypothetical protein